MLRARSPSECGLWLRTRRSGKRISISMAERADVGGSGAASGPATPPKPLDQTPRQRERARGTPSAEARLHIASAASNDVAGDRPHLSRPHVVLRLGQHSATAYVESRPLRAPAHARGATALPAARLFAAALLLRPRWGGTALRDSGSIHVRLCALGRWAGRISKTSPLLLAALSCT